MERSYNDLHEKYQELIAVKLKFEKDIISQQGNLDQEKSAKYMALDKIQELEGKTYRHNRLCVCLYLEILLKRAKTSAQLAMQGHVRYLNSGSRNSNECMNELNF